MSISQTGRDLSARNLEKTLISQNTMVIRNGFYIFLNVFLIITKNNLLLHKTEIRKSTGRSNYSAILSGRYYLSSEYFHI